MTQASVGTVDLGPADADMTLADRAAAAGTVSVDVEAFMPICEGTLGVAEMAFVLGDTHQSFVVDIVAANPGCSYHHAHDGAPVCSMTAAGDISCGLSTLLHPWVEIGLKANGDFTLSAMAHTSHHVTGSLTRV